MDVRLLVLAFPSIVILVLLVAHSLSSLPRSRAVAFWGASVVYGILRGAGVGLITSKGLKGSVPYVVHDPLLSIFGVSLQEIAGWAIVSYLAWWLGYRFSRSLPHFSSTHRQLRVRSRSRPGSIKSPDRSRTHDRADDRKDGDPLRLFPQVLWGCLFLGAISWTIESAAAAAGWWHWTVPVRSRFLADVPFIGLVDWFFVGTDFLLPFVLLSSPAHRRSPWSYASLALFPAHFASHLFTGRLSDAFPVPVFHMAHWCLLAGLVVLALLSSSRDEAFHEPTVARRYLPVLAAILVIVDAALVHVLLGGTFGHLISTLPAIGVLMGSVVFPGAVVLGAAGALLAAVHPGFSLAAVPAAVGWVLRGARSPASRRVAAAGSVAAVMAIALLLHGRSARREGDLKDRLDVALALRDRGDLDGARRTLSDLARDFPDGHAVHALLGEIEYRSHRLTEARAAFREAVAIKPDFLIGRRYLAVIDLQEQDRAAALAEVRAGLRIDPEDLELLYLEARASSSDVDAVSTRAIASGPRAVEGLASLAYEVGDLVGASRFLNRALATWPEERSFYGLRASLALAQNDPEEARRTVQAWRRRFPSDPRAADLARRLGAP